MQTAVVALEATVNYHDESFDSRKRLARGHLSTEVVPERL
jgi:hypothetical protein